MNKFKILRYSQDIEEIKLESKRRAKSKNKKPGEDLEDDFWMFLFETNKFFSINCERESEVEFKTDSGWSKRNVDIIAECPYSRLFIECSEDKNTDKKVHQTISKFNEYQKYIRLEDKNTIQIFYTDKELSSGLKKSLSDANIKLVSKEAINYFRELVSDYPELAYFQFLTYIFSHDSKPDKSELIKKIDSSEYKIPALRGKDQDGVYYVFTIKPSLLLPISTVPHRKMSSLGGEYSKSYQRLINKGKIQKIKKYIQNDGSFPTNLIMNINFEPTFDDVSGGKIGDYKMGTLSLDPRFGALNVIDGQHRLFSYINEENSKKHFLTVTCYVKLSIQKQINAFVNINEKQTPVSPDLLWDLYPELYLEEDIQNGYKVKISKFAKRLNEIKSSPLHFKIRYPSSPRGSKSKAKINLNAICGALKNTNIIGNGGRSSGILVNSLIDDFNIKDNLVDELCLNIMIDFFEASKLASNGNWHSETYSFYGTNQYIGSYMILFGSIYRHITINNEITELENIKELFIKYLKPAQEYINEMSSQELTEFKKGKLGGGGPNGIYLELIKKINNRYNGFEKDKIENIEEESEFDRILNLLEDYDETSVIEAKESFFIDSERWRKTGDLEKNENMTHDIIKTIVAMGNGKGGEILLGIQDPKNNAEKAFINVGLGDTDLNKKGKYFDGNSTEKYKKAILDKIESLAGKQFMHQINVTVVGDNNNPNALIKVKAISKAKLEDKLFTDIKNVAYQRINDSTKPLQPNKFKEYADSLIEDFYVEYKSSSNTSLLNEAEKNKIRQKLPKTCPKCKNKTARNFDEVEKYFGYRRSNDEMIMQSYCFDCR